MSIYDVAEISIIDRDETTHGPVSTATNLEVAVLTDNPVQLVEVVSEGPQGPKGVQNVYIQSNDPSVQFNWGPAEEDYIWIKV
jgi:hypothetical protein